MINDVSGLRDPAIAELCAEAGAALVVMHTRAAPKEVDFPDYGGDVAGDVLRFLAERTALAVRHGVRSEQLVLDPGPDFAKTPAESVEALRALERLQVLRRPVLLAVVAQVLRRRDQRARAGRPAGRDARRGGLRGRRGRGDRPRARRRRDRRVPRACAASWPGRTRCRSSTRPTSG